MRVLKTCEALDKGCCVELYYKDHSLIVEPHAVGFDPDGRPCLLGFERGAGAEPGIGRWIFLSLDETRKVDVSGYLSQAPRDGYARDDPRFRRILCQM